MESESVKGRAEDCPTAWFAVLERANESGDVERAAQALRELRRLGVIVRYVNSKTGEEHV